MNYKPKTNEMGKYWNYLPIKHSVKNVIIAIISAILILFGLPLLFALL